jgi:hypothetical protein
MLADVGSDLRRRTDDQSLGASNVDQEIVEIELHVDFVAGSTQPVEAAFGDFFGDKDPGHGSHRYRRNPPNRKKLDDLFTSGELTAMLTDDLTSPIP